MPPIISSIVSCLKSIKLEEGNPVKPELTLVGEGDELLNEKSSCFSFL